MDHGMVGIELPIVTELIGKTFWIQSQIRIMCPEEWPYGCIVMLKMVEFGLQSIIGGVLGYRSIQRPSFFIDTFIDGMRGGCCCQHIHDQTFVVPPNGK